ncbi:MAG TPA: substrate-binding domain-containing protein [Streptosporangiaceae bacterium]|jgi:hypothetical protein
MGRLLRAVLLLVVGCVVAAAAVVLDARPAEPCGAAPLALRVAAEPDIAPAVAGIAARFTRERHAIDGRCVAVAVTARPSAAVAAGLASGRGSGADAWITDGTAWSDDVRRARGTAFLPDGPVIATSPLVFAVRPGQADRARRTRVTWHALLADGPAPPFTAAVPDPARDATGIAALAALRAAAGTGASAITRLAATMATLRTTHALTPGAGLVVATEREVWAAARDGGGRVAAVYPADGSPSLGYRYLVAAVDRRVRRAAWALGSRLLSASAGRAFTAAGFRGPGGRAAFAAAYGLDPGPVIALAVPGGADETRLRRMWARRHPGLRLLVALDVSAAGPAPGVAADGVRAWLAAMGGADAAGLWTFAGGGRGTAPPYREAVPVRPLDPGQRSALTAALAAPAQVTGTGLAATVLAAYERAQRDYRADRRNAVVVITAARAPSADARTVRALSAAYDPRRPVDLTIVATGPNPQAAQALAAAVHGTALTTRAPSRTRDLLAAVPPRLACGTWCP